MRTWEVRNSGMHEPEELIVAPHVGMRLDDALNDYAWGTAQPVTIDRLWSGESAPHTRHAQAQMCWSDQGLHVRFECNQGEPLVVSTQPVITRKTIGLWERDVCEIFLAPNPDNPSSYFEFEAAPTGEWIDLGIQLTDAGKITDWNYNSGLTVATEVDDSRVVVAMNIPWSTSIVKPKGGERWRVNLFRCVGAEPNSRYLAWRPTRTTEPNFHVPASFGWLIFV